MFANCVNVFVTVLAITCSVVGETELMAFGVLDCPVLIPDFVNQYAITAPNPIFKTGESVVLLCPVKIIAAKNAMNAILTTASRISLWLVIKKSPFIRVSNFAPNLNTISAPYLTSDAINAPAAKNTRNTTIHNHNGSPSNIGIDKLILYPS